jgi:hypothetical protein
VWRLVYDRRHTPAIKRGENRGRTRVHAFVVRAMERLGTWHGPSRRFARDVAARERAGCPAARGWTGLSRAAE